VLARGRSAGRVRRLFALVGVSALALALGGCVEVTFGSYPEASGAGVEARADSHARIELPDYSVDVGIDGFDPDWALVGPLVPIVPIGPWRWLGFIPQSELRVDVYLALEPKTQYGTIVPGSARIVAGEREHRVSEVRVAACQGCNGRRLVSDPMRPMAIIYKAFLQLRFLDCPPPDGPFALEIDGLPRIDYVLEHDTRARLATQ
jgi:hypothetical protein